MYLKDGIKIHPRQTRQFFSKGKDDKRLSARPTLEQMNELGITHYKGKQFKYIYFVCDKRTKRDLIKECTIELNRNYPKQNSLEWKMKTSEGKWVLCDKPPYMTDMDRETRDSTHLEVVR